MKGFSVAGGVDPGPSVTQPGSTPPAQQAGHVRSLNEHWPEYLCEAAELGLFMISASLFTILLWHPSSPVLHVIPNPFARRMLTGMAMGGTAIALIFSPLGKRSGAHFNPAVTLAFWRLGKVKNWDALFYVIAQFVGGILGVLLVSVFAPMALADPSGQLRRDLTRAQRRWHRVSGGVRYRLRAHDGGAAREQHAAPGAFYRPLRRHAGGDLHHVGSTVLWNEHEPGADVRLCFCRSPVDRSLDLFHRAHPSDATGSTGSTSGVTELSTARNTIITIGSVAFSIAAFKICGSVNRRL